MKKNTVARMHWNSWRTSALAAVTLTAVLTGLSPAPASASPLPAAESAVAEDGQDAAAVKDLEARVRDLEAELARMGTASPADPEALAELQRRMEILSREIETLRIGEAAVQADESAYGLGPAAAKIYRTEKGVSIGGYGEMLFESFSDEKDDGDASGKSDKLDFLRAIIYLGYKFNDRILFNSEIEFEHASTGKGGEVSVEFAYLDFMFNDKINARAGMMLVPMGFVNELHEPPIFLGARRPDLERYLIPSTWRENGAGIFGDLGPVSYRAYVITGFDGAGVNQSGFSAAGLRGGRQSGYKSLAEDFAFVARADWEITPGLMLGGSFYTGNSGQGAVAELSGETIDAGTDILDVHLQWRWRGLDVRGLWATAEVDDAALINEYQGCRDRDNQTNACTAGDIGAFGVGSEMDGFYVQVGYDLLATRETEQAIIPFVRMEEYNTQKEVPDGFLIDPSRDVELMTYGVSYKPINNLAIKLDFQDYKNAAGTGVDQWNLAVGWLF